jgi:hypothetical protein
LIFAASALAKLKRIGDAPGLFARNGSGGAKGYRGKVCHVRQVLLSTGTRSDLKIAIKFLING